MDTHPYPTSLVYHQHPQSLEPLQVHPHPSLPAGGQSYPTTVQQSPQQMSWQSSHSPPNSSSSSSSDHSMFATINRQPDHVDFAPQSSYLSRHPQNTQTHHQSQQQHQQFTPADSQHDVQFTSQIEGSIGPARVLTRRRARSGVDEQTGHSSLPDDAYTHSIPYPSSQMPRSGSPNNVPPPPPYSESPDRQPRDGAAARSGHGPLFPLTPVSVSGATSYSSPYTFYPTHSRSTSGSGSGIMSNPRSASPTLSTASGLTSVSSASVPPTQHSPVPLGFVPQPRQKHRKQRLYNLDRKKICIYHRDHPNVKQEEIARCFGVERSTISKILKHKTKWLSVPEETPVLLARQRPTKFPYLEMRLEQWLEECQAKKTIFTDALIREKARSLAKEMDWPEEKFKASSGWVENFKHRHNIRKGVWHGYDKGPNSPSSLGYTVSYGFDSSLNGSSELSSNFPDQSAGQADLSGSSNKDPDHDMGIDTDEEGEGDSNGIALQPAWHDSSNGVDHLMQNGQNHSNAVVNIPGVNNPHEPLPPDLPEPVPIPIRGEDGRSEVAFVIPKPPTYRPPISEPPSMNEVEDAIDKVITFVEHQPEDFLHPSERGVLTNIKCALFQLANGVPYVRDER